MEFITNDGDRYDISLAPCPFCGSEPTMKMVGNAFHKKRSITVKCAACRVKRTDATLRKSNEWLVRVAEKNWNQVPLAKEDRDG